MLQSDSPKPLYEQIKEYILYRIESGEFAPNTRLPSERDLAAQLGVSRLTVNKAIKELEQANWLYAQVGKGTFVKERPIQQEIAALTSLTEDMAIRGQTVSSKILQATLTTPSEKVARTLQISSMMDVVVLERVRSTASGPIALEKSSFLAARCPNILEKHDFSKESLYAVFKAEYGIHLTYAEQTFEARPAHFPETEHLDIAPGTPVLAIHRVTYTEDDQPIEVVSSIYRGDRYTFRARLRRIQPLGIND